jgi:SAM-dependent methyltransferase
MREETWKEVWNRKGWEAARRSEHSVDDLFAADGFDTPLGKTTERSREYLARRIGSLMGAGPGRRILEVGCGAGAALTLLLDTGAALCGVDCSEPHIKIARRALPGCAFHVAEARDLPFPDGVFDGVFSHGVFLYFPDFEYADAVLREMLRVASPAASLLVTDIPDAAKKTECEEARRSAGASLTPPHLYYPKEFFRAFAETHSLALEIFDQDMPEYANSPFRYNALILPRSRPEPRAVK